MSEINIQKPIILKMEVLETDDYSLTLKMKVYVEFIHPTGIFNYTADDIWFEYSKWDQFTNKLHDLRSDVNLDLEDLSEKFKISLMRKTENEYIITLSCLENNLDKGTIQLSYTSDLDSDSMAHVFNNFLGFPKWW